jgi:neutral ceramidase
VPLIAGVSIKDISPRQGVELFGYPHYKRPNTGIHDPLYASCLYLYDNKTKIVIVAMDLTKYSKKYVTHVRNRVSVITGIPHRNIMICCSHTHSSPQTAGRVDLDGIQKGIQPDARYLEELEDKLVSLIVEAVNNTFEARIGIEKGYCGKEQGVGGNRRDPNGPADPEVWVIGVQDYLDRWRAGMVKYALHPTFIHGESTVVTADYPCYIRRYLADSKPGITTLFVQGTSGNQSSRYFRSGQTFGEARRVGYTIGKEADRVLDSMVLSSQVDLFVRSKEVDLYLKKIPSREEAIKEVEVIKEHLGYLKSENGSYLDVRNAEVKLLGAENLLGYIVAGENNKLDFIEDEAPAEVQVIGIGDARIVGFQGEIFVEYGLELKRLSPFDKTIVIELANGALPGYLCTSETYVEGGYEAGTSLLTAKTGEMFVNTALELLHD